MYSWGLQAAIDVLLLVFCVEGNMVITQAAADASVRLASVKASCFSPASVNPLLSDLLPGTAD